MELRDIDQFLVRPFARALLFPETGAVADPGSLIEAYAKLLRELGCDILDGKVEALTQDGAGWIARTTAGDVLAKQAVLAAGAWSDELARSLGYRLPLASERGYHRQFARGAGPVLNRPVYDTGGGYIVAPMGDKLRVLSGVEPPRAALHRTTRRFRALLQKRRRPSRSGPRLTTNPGWDRGLRRPMGCQ